MDPEHIFRILNVFAAHFDSSEYFEYSDKFGFDKIIIVCDYTNLKKIFHHKFGIDTDFIGYIDKFFSTSRFEYDNIKAISSIIDNSYNNSQFYFLKIILKDLLITNNLSLREILKIRKLDINIIKKEILDKNYLATIEFLIELALLLKITDFDTVIKKIINCKSQIIKYSDNYDYDYLLKKCIPTLIQSKNSIAISSDLPFPLKIDNEIINFKIVMNSERTYIANPIDNSQIKFSSRNFYTIFLQLAEKYRNII